MAGWINEGRQCRLRYIDITDGPVTFSHRGPGACPVHTQQDSQHTHTHTHTHPHPHIHIYAQRAQVDLFVMYREEHIAW